jgi:hypothetical protein
MLSRGNTEARITQEMALTEKSLSEKARCPSLFHAAIQWCKPRAQAGLM